MHTYAYIHIQTPHIPKEVAQSCMIPFNMFMDRLGHIPQSMDSSSQSNALPVLYITGFSWSLFGSKMAHVGSKMAPRWPKMHIIAQHSHNIAPT